MQDALEKHTKIEAMVGYPYENKGGVTSSDISLLGLQHQIVELTEKLKDMDAT